MKKLIFGLIAITLLSCYSYGQTQPPRHLVFVGYDEWGRASKKCDGWGLCNARWFYWESDVAQKNSFQMQVDPKTNEYYFTISLDESTKTEYSKENLNSIIVDEDIILSTKAALGKDLTITKGEYLFDNSLNGYYIPLK